MAKRSLLLSFLAPFFSQSFALLSHDLIDVVFHALAPEADSSINSIDHITEVADQINAAAASISNSSAPTPEQRASISCAIESLVFPESVTTASSSQYEVDVTINWSETCWLPAACFVHPQNTIEVAVALKVITAAKSKFAVRGGGHNPNPGYSSVDDVGVLIDLQLMKSLSFESDGTIMRAGPGNRWLTMYEFSEAHGRLVKGGRTATVGIPGYLLGAGMPYFPGLHGMAADSITNYEVVLADSRIINANANENSELFLSLKGGGLNFGIVTRFDIQTYPVIHAQYAVNVYDAADYHNIFEATKEVQRRMESDNKVDTFLAISPSTISIGMLYADTPAKPPTVFEPFLQLESQVDTLIPLTNGTVLSLAEALIEVMPTSNARRIATTTSTKVDSGLYERQHERFLQIVQDNQINAGLSYNIQPVPSSMIREGNTRGGNSCGLSEIPQTWWSFVVEWDDEADDVTAQQTSNSFREVLETTAEEQDLLLRYRFMNHASFMQTVLDSYGPENVERFRSVSATYDPEGVFQELQNDGFLLRKL
ncbi:hypothetical protein DL765_007812 [Monosporascus sp. GIB2]|nr:hypothetical protein DL765_007812 [Monosporascus sp. GIB2]